jgi:hypothetical protein
VKAGKPGGGLPASESIGVTQSFEYQNAQGQYENVPLISGLAVGFTYNGFGKITAVTYPSTVNANDMYRLSGMTDSNNNTIVGNVSYNAANQLLTMNYPAANEVRGSLPTALSAWLRMKSYTEVNSNASLITSSPISTISFVAERNHRIDSRGPAGGNTGCEQRH